jgi:environmental stress-induced protein Ves
VQASVFHRFYREQLPCVPWKNGGGVTREIACYPAGADLQSFEWRISIADITHDGPFSDFSGIDRVITLLSGKGVRLVSQQGEKGDIDHLLDEPFQPFYCSGDLPITADLLDGPCQDFNVMTRRGVCAAQVSICRNSNRLGPAPAGVLMSLFGAWHLNTETLDPGQGLWWSDKQVSWTASPQTKEATLLAALIHPVRV